MATTAQALRTELRPRGWIKGVGPSEEGLAWPAVSFFQGEGVTSLTGTGVPAASSSTAPPAGPQTLSMASLFRSLPGPLPAIRCGGGGGRLEPVTLAAGPS